MGSAYVTGYYVGVIALLLVLAAIFWLAGRWGWIGIIIRAVCVGIAILRILSLVAHPPAA